MNCYYYYWYSALGPVWAETRVQSGDWYGSGTLHPGQILRGSLPLLPPMNCTMHLLQYSMLIPIYIYCALVRHSLCDRANPFPWPIYFV